MKLRMPGVSGMSADDYLCVSYPIPEDAAAVAFRPRASMKIAHHVLIKTCSRPGMVRN